jgi:SAM-dependent methyltransferase
MTQARISRLLYGLATFIPGVYRLFSMPAIEPRALALDGYSKWLQHLAFSYRHGFRTFPRVVAELGPGPCCPSGIAALVSGVDTYYALDSVRHPHSRMAPQVFDEIVRLLTARRPPEPARGRARQLTGFPADILSDSRLKEALGESRLAGLREDVYQSVDRNRRFRYCVPWASSEIIEHGALDMIFSSAVLEHVDDLGEAYALMAQYLKPDGLMSHVIDFGCHGVTRDWNGHWTCSDLTWRLLRGGRPYLINRAPHSAHTDLLKAHGFRVVADVTSTAPSMLRPEALASGYGFLSSRDLTTRRTTILAVKERTLSTTG